MASAARGFGAAWRHRRWRGYLIAVANATTGDFLYSVALVVYLLDTTGSATWVAAAVVSRMAVYTAVGPIGGVIADRFDRRRLMVSLDGGRMLLMLAAGWVMLAGGPPLLLLAVVTGLAACTTPYRPAAVAATPLLVGEDDLVAANAAEASVGQLGWFAGPALAAAIVTTAGPSAACFVTAGLFAVSAVAMATVGDVGGGDRSATRDPVLWQLREGARTLRRVSGLPALTMMAMAVLFAYGVETVVHVLVVSERLGRDPGTVGALTACMGAGGLLAVPFAAQLGARPDSGRLLAVSGMLMGLPLALLSVTSSVVVAGGLMVVEGVGNMMFDVLLITLLQRACPEHLLGRVFSLQDSAGSLAQLAGTVAAPVLVSLLNLEVALVAGGGALVLAATLLAPRLQAISIRTESERVALAPIVAELAGVGIFGDASRAALERIARSSSSRHVAAGDVIFTEGDPPHELFVVRSGSVVVTTAAEGEIRRLAAGDWFGEIGLLRGVPRTATVASLEPAELLAIPGKVFLDAVNGQERMPDPLGTKLTMRLARTHPHLLEPSAG
jgi:CRP-like cAMP-binding protein/predicted MFS family arabinose efflux permease